MVLVLLSSEERRRGALYSLVPYHSMLCVIVLFQDPRSVLITSGLPTNVFLFCYFLHDYSQNHNPQG